MLAVAALAAPSPSASAHSFGQLYNLPVPLWMYLYGASAALLLSFLCIAYFVGVAPAPVTSPEPKLDTEPEPGPEPMQVVGRGSASRGLRIVVVSLLGLCIASGLFGSRNPYANFSMTCFWIVFLLAFQYLCALTGDIYASANPWRALVDALGRIWPRSFSGRIRYPPALGSWPALGFYMLLVGFELFGGGTPHALGIWLLGYTIVNLCGAWLVGTSAWFAHCECFGVLFDLIGRISPMAMRRTAQGRTVVRWRIPLSGLISPPARDFGELMFVLFMLSSTAYDGLRETAPWVRFFWHDVYQAVLIGILGPDVAATYPTLQTLYRGWQLAALVLSPGAYLLAFLLAIVAAQRLVHATQSVRELALRFALTLVPIAFVYSLSHYFTLVITQGPQIIRQLSDPFGRGWNLFGTIGWLSKPYIPGAGLVWNAQVTMIVAGHVASVYLGHRVASASFGDPRRAIVSQIPLLILMMVYTVAGLWILSQPITSGQVLVPNGS